MKWIDTNNQVYSCKSLLMQKLGAIWVIELVVTVVRFPFNVRLEYSRMILHSTAEYIENIYKYLGFVKFAFCGHYWLFMVVKYSYRA